MRTWLKLPSQDSVLNLIRQLDHRVDLLTGLLPFLEQLLKFTVHGILPAEEGVDLVLLDWETSLDRLLTGPVFSVCLPLDKDLNSR